MKEPDSLSVDHVAVLSIIFRVVLHVNNSETHVSEDVLIEDGGFDKKRLTKVFVLLDLWTGRLGNKEEARLLSGQVFDTISSRAS